MNALNSNQMDTRRIARLAILVSLCHVGRVMLGFLPNVQPMTVILLLLTIVFGFSDGLIVAVLSILISNLQMGMGVWTFAQIGTYIAVVAITAFISPILRRLPLWLSALYAGFTGFLYGFLISLIQSIFFSWLSFFPYWIAGLSFDLFHALGNIGFWIILYPILMPLFEKQKRTERNAHLKNRLSNK